MAASSWVSQELNRNLFKNAESFEKDLKSKLIWNREHWIEAGQLGSKLNRLVNSLNYWKKKLKPALGKNGLVLTLFNEQKNVKISILELFIEVEKLDSRIKVTGFSEFRNPRYVSLYFSTEEGKMLVAEKFKMVNDSYVVFIHWALESGFDVLKVHWIPLAIDIDAINAEVEKYVTIIEITRKSLLLVDGRSMPSGKITYKVNFKEGVQPEQIPHLTMIEEMEALITVKGRAPLCLNCGVLGHISRTCKLRYCETCKMQMAKDHKCLESGEKASYAGVLRRGERSPSDPDDWGPSFSSGARDEFSAKQLMDNKRIIEDKIANLETQIGKGDALGSPNLAISERKRKALDTILEVSGEWGDRSISPVDLVVDGDADDSNQVDMESLPASNLAGLEAAGLPSPVGITGSSSLTQRPENKRSYAKFGALTKLGSRAQKEFDKLDTRRDFVFSD